MMTITPEYYLVDHEGRPRDSTAAHGHWSVYFFGFTHCHMVCPRALARLDGILEAVDGRVAPLDAYYVTVDPERDDPATMKAYLAAHPRFTGLTGTREWIDAAKRSFHVFAAREADPRDPDGYAMPHSAFSYLVDPDGVCVAHFADSVDAAVVVDRLLALVPPQEGSR